MLLRDLTIENFRSFDKYQLNGLARVNLLVGDNNCGKTSVLEAVEIYCSSSPVATIRKAAQRRSELVPSMSERVAGRAVESVAGFFRNRTVQPGSRFSITDTDPLTAEITLKQSPQRRPIDTTTMDPLDQTLVLQVSSPRFASPPDSLARLEPTGGFVQNAGYGYVGVAPEAKQVAPPLEFVGPDSGTSGDLSARWNRVILGGLKERVLDAVRILHPLAADINSLSGSSARLSGSQIVLTLKGDHQPWQFGSLGEGSRRVFAIASTLASCEHGVAILDELDTGLHYSRLPAIWRMVIKAAQELDVQVFATTHSLDCIRGLANAVQQDDSLTAEVALFRIDRRSDEAVRFGGEELPVVAENEIEVR